MGNRPIWLFDPGWQSAMDGPASVSMAHLNSLFLSRPWQELVPDQKHTVVTSGLGEFNGLDTVTAARTADGCTVIAYLPAGRTVCVDLSKVSGQKVRAWWYDPRAGSATTIGQFPTSGSRQFTPPDKSDWVLILDDAARGLTAPGTVPIK